MNPTLGLFDLYSIFEYKPEISDSPVFKGSARGFVAAVEDKFGGWIGSWLDWVGGCETGFLCRGLVYELCIMLVLVYCGFGFFG